MNFSKLRPGFSFILFLLLMALPIASYGAVKVLPEPGTDPKLVQIIDKVVVAFEDYINRQLKVSLTKDIKIFVCPDNASYISIIIREFKRTRDEAERTAKISGGLANQKGLIAITLDPGNSWDPESHAYYATAHELMHQLQFQLSDNKYDKTLYWMMEGTADYISAQVVAAMKYQNFTEWKIETFNAVRHAKNKVSPNQIAYIGWNEWRSFMEEFKNPYHVADLMVLYLISTVPQNGEQSIIDYFRRTSNNEADSVNFEKSFGISLQVFSKNVVQWMESTMRMLGNAQIDFNGNFESLAIDEAFYRSQIFFKDSFGEYVRSKQQIVIAPEKYTYRTELIKTLGLSREQADAAANAEPWRTTGNKTALNLQAVPDPVAQFFNTAYMMTLQFQKQQNPKHLSKVPAWLKNGMISAFAALITEQSDLVEANYYQRLWLNEIRPITGSLRLIDLQTEDGWKQAVDKYGASTVNSYAGLAALYLFRQKGIPAFNKLVNFNAQEIKVSELFVQIFGETVEAFSIKLETYIKEAD